MTLNDFLDLFNMSELFQTYGSRMLEGLAVTAKLVGISFSLGMMLGLLIAFGRMSSNAVLQRICAGLIYFFRGTPLLAQLFLLYYGLGSFRPFWQEVGLWWFFRDPWYCAMLAFTINTAVYQAEIFRGGFLAIDRGQHEAAKVLGLSRMTTFFKVTLPQMLLVALGPLGNELILMVKASAIASLVTIYDVMGVARLAFSRTLDFEVYLWAAILYLLIVEIVRRGLKLIESRLTRHLQ